MSRLFADMVAAVPSSVDLLESRTHDSFATIEPKGAGFTWVPVPIGLGTVLQAPPKDLIYTTRRAAYEGRKRAITALLSEGFKELKCAE